MAQEPGGTYRKANAGAFLSFAEFAVALQKEMIQTCERLGRAWLDRVQTEVELWNCLARNVTSSKSVAEAPKAHAGCISNQIRH